MTRADEGLATGHGRVQASGAFVGTPSTMQRQCADAVRIPGRDELLR